MQACVSVIHSMLFVRGKFRQRSHRTKHATAADFQHMGVNHRCRYIGVSGRPIPLGGAGRENVYKTAPSRRRSFPSLHCNEGSGCVHATDRGLLPRLREAGMGCRFSQISYTCINIQYMSPRLRRQAGFKAVVRPELYGQALRLSSKTVAPNYS